MKTWTMNQGLLALANFDFVPLFPSNLTPILHYSLCLNYLISADAIIHSSPLTQCSFNLRLFDGCSCGISLECNHPSNLSLSSTIKKQVGKVAKDEKETSNRDSERAMKIFTFEPSSIPTALIC